MFLVLHQNTKNTSYMKYFILIVSMFLFFNCHSRLDKPENLPMMIDETVNPNLKISVETFMNNPLNKEYLEKNCRKINQNRKNEWLYAKDSSFIQVYYDVAKEIHIKSVGDFLNYGFKIGQTRNDFETIFYEIEKKEHTPYIHIQKDKIEFSETKIGEAVWSFHFENDRLKSIDFVGI
jgi:hypothetical protein